MYLEDRALNKSLNIVLTRKLLHLATSTDCKIYKDFSDKWIFRGCRPEGEWTLEEHEAGQWLLKFNGAEGIILNTGEVIKSFEIISSK
ncbi:hypothetical protein IQ255_13080 [Pleurocapsales cyanobacterium LEGE 10410]|nr:hypothetical protein [Pleurocapsales cyanobacterium LEGE 10410]